MFHVLTFFSSYELLVPVGVLKNIQIDIDLKMRSLNVTSKERENTEKED